jgi:hypothetical protein
MNLTEAFATILFYRAPDGRTVFRPWGRLGKCYLVDEAGRRRLTRFFLGFSALMIIAMVVVENLNGLGLVFALILPVWLGGIYAAFWVFARDLPETDPPLPPPPEYRDQVMRGYSRSLGKPLLWTLEVASLLFVAVGLYLTLVDGNWKSGLLPVAFFGWCAITFARQLRSL